MRKEILFAIVAGALFGLVIAFGIWKANSALKPESAQETLSSDISPSPSPPPDQLGITLAKPDQNQVFTEEPVTFSGMTQPNAWLTISGEEEDYIIKADENGSFEQEVDLISGANEVVITTFNKDGYSEKESVLAVYSTKFDEEKSSPSEEVEKDE